MMDYRLKLIGYPIQHSLSPWIHNKFLERTHLKGTYTLHEISPDASFDENVLTLKKEKVDGFNVTVPYKEEIIPYLDMLDDTAKQMGAVNTVVYREGKWIGYNTDGIGYLRSLESKYPTFFQNKSKRILLIGAGGAARGIYYALDRAGFDCIDIANRTKASAEEIAKLATLSSNTKVVSLKEAEEGIGNYDLIIQTTSVGMKPNVDTSILSFSQVKENAIASDIVYQPLQTKFLKEAEKNGAAIHYGHTMLLYQAQYAFEIWTNQKVPMDDLDLQLQTILEGR